MHYDFTNINELAKLTFEQQRLANLMTDDLMW